LFGPVENPFPTPSGGVDTPTMREKRIVCFSREMIGWTFLVLRWRWPCTNCHSHPTIPYAANYSVILQKPDKIPFPPALKGRSVPSQVCDF